MNPEACVMASGIVVKGCQIPFGGDIYLLVSYAVHHRQAGQVSAMQQGIPTKVLTHCRNTAFEAVALAYLPLRSYARA